MKRRRQRPVARAGDDVGVELAGLLDERTLLGRPGVDLYLQPPAGRLAPSTSPRRRSVDDVVARLLGPVVVPAAAGD